MKRAPHSASRTALNKTRKATPFLQRRYIVRNASALPDGVLFVHRLQLARSPRQIAAQKAKEYVAPTAEQIQEMGKFRQKDPLKYTTLALSKQFNVDPVTVFRLLPVSTAPGRKVSPPIPAKTPQEQLQSQLERKQRLRTWMEKHTSQEHSHYKERLIESNERKNDKNQRMELVMEKFSTAHKAMLEYQKRLSLNSSHGSSENHPTRLQTPPK